jgi:hypothetical protein
LVTTAVRACPPDPRRTSVDPFVGPGVPPAYQALSFPPSISEVRGVESWFIVVCDCQQ